MPETHLNWSKSPSGGWWLWKEPPGTPRLPFGGVSRYSSGLVIGYVHGSNLPDIEGRSVAAVKRRVEAQAAALLAACR